MFTSSTDEPTRASDPQALVLYLDVTVEMAEKVATILRSQAFAERRKGRFRALSNELGIPCGALNEVYQHGIDRWDPLDVIEHLTKTMLGVRNVPHQLMAAYWERRAGRAEANATEWRNRFEKQKSELETVRARYRALRRPCLLSTSDAAKNIGVSTSTVRKYAALLSLGPEQVEETTTGRGSYRRDHIHHLWSPEDVRKIAEHPAIQSLVAKRSQKNSGSPRWNRI